VPAPLTLGMGMVQSGARLLGRFRSGSNGEHSLGQGNEFRLTPGIGVEMPCDFHRLDGHLLPSRALPRRCSLGAVWTGAGPQIKLLASSGSMTEADAKSLMP